VADMRGHGGGRQLIRLCRRLSVYEDETVYEGVHKACLSRFLPPLPRAALVLALARAGVAPPGGRGVSTQVEGEGANVRDDGLVEDPEAEARVRHAHAHGHIHIHAYMYAYMQRVQVCLYGCRSCVMLAAIHAYANERRNHLSAHRQNAQRMDSPYPRIGKTDSFSACAADTRGARCS
jgi:hypothetical protein